MHKYSLSKIAAASTLALALAACSADGGGTGNGGSGGNGGSTGQLILDETQTNVSGLLSGLGNTLAVGGTQNPLSALVTCLDPTLNDFLDGPDALLTNLLGSINAALQTQDPAALQEALIASGDSLAGGVQSLTVNLPIALGALADPTIADNGCQSVGGGTGTPLDQLIALFGGGANPFAGTPLEPLGALGGAGTPAGGPTGTPLDVILGPLLAIQQGGGGIGGNGELLDQLGQGVSMLGTQLAAAYPQELNQAPVIGGVVNLLSDALIDLGAVVDQIEQPSTATQLEGTLNNLLSNLVGTLASLDPSGNLSNAGLQDGIDTLTGTLGDTLLQPLAGTGGLLPTVLNPLGALTCPLMLTGACDSPSSAGVFDTSSFGDLASALEGTPLAPLGGLLSGLLGGLI